MGNTSKVSNVRRSIAAALLAVVVQTSMARVAFAHAAVREWLGEEMPLPLSVKTPQDLAVKAVAERQYLIFNLLAGGKMAWDAGDFATAAAKWESLLRVPGLDPEIVRVMRPLAVAARGSSGGVPVAAATPPG
ncbi:MAG: hypothetical protein JWM82_3820, partial [Myxococcales bacterium]|nr:hypothetical protein [Myxococcales bacterium]